MKRRDLLAAARFALELVLAVPVSEATFAMGTDVPPAMECHLVIRPHAEGSSAGVAPGDQPPRRTATAEPGAIVHPLLDCRLRSTAESAPVAAPRRAQRAGTRDVAAR